MTPFSLLLMFPPQSPNSFFACIIILVVSRQPFNHHHHQCRVMISNHRHNHLHELVSSLEPAEHPLLVCVQMHLQPHGALGTHHGSWRGLVAVSEMLRDDQMKYRKEKITRGKIDNKMCCAGWILCVRPCQQMATR